MWSKGDAVGQRNLKEGEYVDYPILTLIDSKDHFLLKLDDKTIESVTGYELSVDAEHGKLMDLTLHLTVEKGSIHTSR